MYDSIVEGLYFAPFGDAMDLFGFWVFWDLHFECKIITPRHTQLRDFKHSLCISNVMALRACCVKTKTRQHVVEHLLLLKWKIKSNVDLGIRS